MKVTMHWWTNDNNDGCVMWINYSNLSNISTRKRVARLLFAFEPCDVVTGQSWLTFRDSLPVASVAETRVYSPDTLSCLHLTVTSWHGGSLLKSTQRTGLISWRGPCVPDVMGVGNLAWPLLKGYCSAWLEWAAVKAAQVSQVLYSMKLTP